MSDTQQSPLTPPDPAGPPWTPSPEPQRRRRRVGTVALVAGGLVAGGVLGGTLSAVASSDGSPSSAVSSAAQGAEPGAPSGQGYGMQTPPSGEEGGTLTPPSGEVDGQRDESQSQRPDETLLTGETAAKVEAAAIAQYPGATVLRVETDSDGVYEAHLVTADGQRVTVAVGEDFAVTGVQEMGDGGPGRHGGRGPGGPMGDGSGATSPDGQATPDGSDGASGQESGLSS